MKMKVLLLIISLLLLLSKFIDSYKIILNENDDDDNDPSDVILDGIFKCANTIKKKCNLGAKPKLNETLICLKEKFPVLQHSCMKVFNGLLKDVIKSCGIDLLTQCQSEVATLSPSEGVSCLFKHYSSVSSTCRVQLDLLASYALPCANEAAKYCSMESNPQDIFACLSAVSTTEPSGTLDPVCYQAIAGYQNCLPMGDTAQTNDDRNNQVPFDDDDDDDERNHHVNDSGVDDFDDDDDDDDGGNSNNDDVDDGNIYSIIEGNDDESSVIPWFGSGDDTYDDDNSNVEGDFYNDDEIDDDSNDDDYVDDNIDDYTDDNMDDEYLNDDYSYDYSPKPKQKPKPKAKPKPKPNGGDGHGKVGAGKTKPNVISNKNIQAFPQKPFKNKIVINERKLQQPGGQGQIPGGQGGIKPKPKPGPGQPGGTLKAGGNTPGPGIGKPCWVVDDAQLNEFNGKDNDIKDNFNRSNFKYGGVIAFIAFIVSISIIGSLIYLWFKNGRSFRNLTVLRASEIISEKDPYESGYAPTAADDHDDGDANDRMLQLPESDNGGSIEMSTLNPISGNGYSKLAKDDEVSV